MVHIQFLWQLVMVDHTPHKSPGPIIIAGVMESVGNTKVPGTTQTGTLAPGSSDANQLEHTPYTPHSNMNLSTLLPYSSHLY